MKNPTGFRSEGHNGHGVHSFEDFHPEPIRRHRMNGKEELVNPILLIA